ncbi:hypothetical protein HEC60_25110 (plasmid) [Yokenella regensburgei]|nr:hypothetical protein HEC60_25110 [Yokenella regensburgei]
MESFNGRLRQERLNDKSRCINQRGAGQNRSASDRSSCAG